MTTTRTACTACTTYAEEQAVENWSADRGHVPTTDAELTEVASWTRIYVSEGTVTCSSHAAS